MKKSLIALIIVSLLAIGGAVVAMNSMNTKTSKKETTKTAEAEGSTQKEAKAPTEKSTSESAEVKKEDGHDGHDHDDHSDHDHEMKNEKTEAASVKNASYISYADYTSKMDMYKDTKRIFFFHAKWCSVCNALDGDLKTGIEKLPKNTTVIMVDFDKELDLRKKYGVTSQTTFVQVDASGERVAKWNAASLSTIIAGIK